MTLLNRPRMLAIAFVLLSIGTLIAAPVNQFGGNIITNRTEAADTAIVQAVGANAAGRTRITKISYTCAGTAHTLTVMRPLAKTTTSATASSGQAVIKLTDDPGAAISNSIAANDFLVLGLDSGVYKEVKVSSVSGLDITLTANLGAALTKGATVWFYGVVGDTDTKTGLPHPKWTTPTSATTNYTGDGELLVNSHDINQPLVVHSSNVTAAGTIVEIIWKFTDK